MGLSEELRDPWGLVIAGVAGGLSWALAAPVAAAVAVGAGVYGVKVLAGVLVGTTGGDEASDATPLARPPRGSHAAWWLDRAERAVGSLRSLASTAAPGATRLAVDSAVSDASGTLADLSRVAAQVTAVEAAERQVDAAGLAEQVADLEQRASYSANPEQAAELRRAATAVRDRLAVSQRLDDARETLVARMAATALGLEGLRAGLAEAEALTRRVLDP